MIFSEVLATADEAIQLRDGLITIIFTVGMELDKWSFMNKSVLNGVCKNNDKSICLLTRAVHLELVNDFSSAAFICALNRFFDAIII